MTSMCRILKKLAFGCQDTNYKRSIIIKKLVFVFIVLIVFFILGYNIILEYLYPTKYSEYVYKYSEKYNVEPSLIFAIIKAESNFKADAISREWSSRINANYGGNGK